MRYTWDFSLEMQQISSKMMMIAQLTISVTNAVSHDSQFFIKKNRGSASLNWYRVCMWTSVAIKVTLPPKAKTSFLTNNFHPLLRSTPLWIASKAIPFNRIENRVFDVRTNRNYLNNGGMANKILHLIRSERKVTQKCQTFIIGFYRKPLRFDDAPSLQWDHSSRVELFVEYTSLDASGYLTCRGQHQLHHSGEYSRMLFHAVGIVGNNLTREHWSKQCQKHFKWNEIMLLERSSSYWLFHHIWMWVKIYRIQGDNEESRRGYWDTSSWIWANVRSINQWNRFSSESVKWTNTLTAPKKVIRFFPWKITHDQWNILKIGWQA